MRIPNKIQLNGLVVLGLDVAGAPYGSAYLPAERPSGACSLWRTFRVQADLPIRASASLQVPVNSVEVTYSLIQGSFIASQFTAVVGFFVSVTFNAVRYSEVIVDW